MLHAPNPQFPISPFTRINTSPPQAGEKTPANLCWAAASMHSQVLHDAVRCHGSRLGSRLTPKCQPVTLRHQRRVRAASTADAPDLRRLLAQKEAQLASMFESGRPMPKASEVAQLREEIVALDAQISGRPVGSPPPRSAAVQPPPPGTHTHVRARTSTEEMALRAYEMVEQQLRSNQGLGAADDMADDIARLEAENSQLRVVAYDLLQRQHQLETLLAEVRGAQPPQLLIETTEDILNRMKAKLQKVVP